MNYLFLACSKRQLCCAPLSMFPCWVFLGGCEGIFFLSFCCEMFLVWFKSYAIFLLLTCLQLAFLLFFFLMLIVFCAKNHKLWQERFWDYFFHFAFTIFLLTWLCQVLLLLQMVFKETAELEGTKKAPDVFMRSSHTLIIGNENTEPELFLSHMIILLTLKKATLYKMVQTHQDGFCCTNEQISIMLHEVYIDTFFHCSHIVLCLLINYENNWKGM